jgi:nucleoside-diphosphate-sugar epimerase
MTSDRVLITGGAGFLGINLIRFLLPRGHAITSLDLAEFEYPDVRGQIRLVRGDIRDPETVRRAMDGARWVVHAAAALPLYTPHDIRTTDIDGTRHVLDGALAAGVERVVHVSSTAVYGIPDHHPLREEDPVHGVGPYGEAKVEAEALCRRYRAKGLCVPILRPKSFVGPERLGSSPSSTTGPRTAGTSRCWAPAPTATSCSTSRTCARRSISPAPSTPRA